MRFGNQSVLVTGGATGIGYAITKRFVSEGAKVVMVGRREEVGRKAERELSEQGFDVHFVQGDVSVEADVERFVQETVDLNGKIDVLVNNAAMSNEIKFLDKKTAKWRKVFNIIVDGAYFCSRTAAQSMIDAGIHGKIVNVSSINAYRALYGSSHYNAAKGALDQLTRCMALELAEHGIRVNGVGPGFVDTPMSVLENGKNELESVWFQSIYVENQKIPLQRAGLPEEIASVVSFLSSQDASYICGATIPVDGGLSITF